MASIVERSRNLSFTLDDLRFRIRDNEPYQEEIKGVRTEIEALITYWRGMRDQVTDDSWFSVLEALIDARNNVDKVYLVAVARGRGRDRRTTVSFRDDGRPRDHGVPTTLRNRLEGRSRFDSSLGTRQQVYGYQGTYRYTVTFGDTLRSIALVHTGNADNWILISQANGFSRQHEVSSGDTILIPAINATGADVAPSNDFILSESTGQSSDLTLGTDIRVDETEGIVPDSQGGVDTVSGLENVKQALNHRLRTQLGSLVQHNATYGLPHVIGIPGIGLSANYVRIAIRNTLIQDPRVDQVLRVDVETRGDTIEAEISVRLVRNIGFLNFGTQIGV